MSSTNPTPTGALSKRHRRMLQDMGIDVFSTRGAEPVAAAQASKPRASSAAQAALAEAKNTAKSAATANAQAPAPDMDKLVEGAAAGVTATGAVPTSADSSGATLAPSQVRIDLTVVGTASLVYLGGAALSNVELRFLQDLAGAIYWLGKQTVLTGKVRSSEFRWPIVEATGTPERTVAVFCEKHRLFETTTTVLASPEAFTQLSPWINGDTGHWLRIDELIQAAADGDAKRALWQRVLQNFSAASGT